MTVKENLDRLIDELAEDELQEIEAFAEFLAFRRLRDRVAHGSASPDELRRFLEAKRPPRLATSEQADLALDDPVLKALETAPWDDEPETPEEAEAVRKAREAVARGDVVSNEE